MRCLKVLAWTLGCLILVAGATEILARVALGLEPLRYSASYDPVFVSGESRAGRSRDELSRSSNGPAAYDYSATPSGAYLWNGDVLPRSLTSLSDFLFGHYLSRYSSRDVDSITCRQPDALGIFVLGGSVALGTSASSQLSTWHALLERMLRKDLQRSDIYVFNAAMTGFRSIQERLAYHLAVFPRAARLVLIVNGANDFALGPSSAVRPGDPSRIAARYDGFYGNPLMLWLIERSAALNGIFQASLVRSVLQHRERISRSDEVFDRYANSVVDLYLENMSAILQDCEANGTTCLVGVQPVRSVSASYIGSQRFGPYVMPPERVRRIYDLLHEKLRGHRYSAHFVDLTHLIGTESELDYFTDSVHFNDRGQELLADALLPAVESAIKQIKPTAAREPIISCERVLPKEIAAIDLARITRQNAGEVGLAGDVATLVAVPQQWSYSAAVTIGDHEDLSRPDTSIRVRIRSLSGEIGVGLLPDIGAKEFLSERSIPADAKDADVGLDVPKGIKRVVVIFRKQAADGQRSEVSIQKIAVEAP